MIHAAIYCDLERNIDAADNEAAAIEAARNTEVSRAANLPHEVDRGQDDPDPRRTRGRETAVIRAVVASGAPWSTWLERGDTTPDRTALVARFERMERKPFRW